jgi:hypothetical protein
MQNKKIKIKIRNTFHSSSASIHLLPVAQPVNPFFSNLSDSEKKIRKNFKDDKKRLGNTHTFRMNQNLMTKKVLKRKTKSAK